MSFSSPGNPEKDAKFSALLDQLKEFIDPKSFNNYSAELCRRSAAIAESMKTLGLKYYSAQKNKAPSPQPITKDIKVYQIQQDFTSPLDDCNKSIESKAGDFILVMEDGVWVQSINKGTFCLTVYSREFVEINVPLLFK